MATEGKEFNRITVIRYPAWKEHYMTIKHRFVVHRPNSQMGFLVIGVDMGNGLIRYLTNDEMIIVKGLGFNEDRSEFNRLRGTEEYANIPTYSGTSKSICQSSR